MPNRRLGYNFLAQGVESSTWRATGWDRVAGSNPVAQLFANAGIDEKSNEPAGDTLTI